MKKFHKVAIIGAGSVGRAIGYQLAKKEYNIAYVVNRSEEKANESVNIIGAGKGMTNPIDATKNADVIFITLPDDFIQPTCEKLAKEGCFKPKSIVLHTSGALTSKVLKTAKNKGAYTGSIHPMGSFPKTVNRLSMYGIYWGYEGDQNLADVLEELIIELDGIPMKINPKKKGLYHAASAMACNGLFPLIYNAVEFLKEAGASEIHAKRAITSLVKTSLNNVFKNDVLSSLTGPVERGDVKTISNHVKQINKFAPNASNLYNFMSMEVILLALKKQSISNEKGMEILDLLKS